MDQRPLAGKMMLKEKNNTILIVPPDSTKTEEVRFNFIDGTSIWSALNSIFTEEQLPVILSIDAKYADLLRAGAQLFDISVKTITGYPAEYSSHWSITFNNYPAVSFTELKDLGDDSRAVGGEGIRNSDKPRPEIDQPDPEMRAKLKGLAKDDWSSEGEDYDG
jgi:hypothetical protein